MAKEQKKLIRNLTFANLLALFLVPMFSGATSLTNAALQTYIEAFPEVATATVRGISTIPSIVSMIVMMLIGFVAGRKIGYRPIMIVGYCLMLIGGVVPYFCKTISSILFFRGILGAGAGCLGVRNALIIRSVGTEKSGWFIGLGAVSLNLANMVMQPLCGRLADIRWNVSFLIYLILIVIIVLLTAFLKEPEKETDMEVKAEKGKLRDINPKVFVLIAAQLISTLAIYPVNSGISTFVVEKGLGTAALAGTMLSCFTAGTLVTNALLQPINNILKNKVLSVGFTLVTIGVAVILFVPKTVTVGLGMFLVGMGFSMFLSSVHIICGRIATPSTLALSSSLVLAANQAAIFLSSYWITAYRSLVHFGSEVESSFLACIIACIALTLCLFFVKWTPAEKK
ncbi:MAG: MFS transporter [Oscillospiraceae bacterium]|nr:MFS transporter [Oscillospiraceae bacterium]